MRFLKNSELGRPDREGYKKLEKMPVVVVLDNIRSGANVGSIFRTCDAFAVDMLMLCGITAIPPDREVLKTALGATETISWKQFPSTQEALIDLKNKGYKIFAVEQADTSVTLVQFKETWSRTPIVLVFGNEVKGVDDALIPLLDGCVEIPQSGTKHSLNVSVCLGVVLWELYRK
ncbi:MAG: RNA methyltransferase [Bacteroidota bacterium]